MDGVCWRARTIASLLDPSRKVFLREVGIVDVAKRIAGKWDAREGPRVPPFRVRWFFSWTEYAPGCLAGFIAGYEGGRAFIEERFNARFRGRSLASFVWNGVDHARDRRREARPVAAGVAAMCDEHYEIFLEWHDREEWERGFLCLAPGRERRLARVGTSLLLPAADESAMERIAAMSRRTGILCRF